MTFRLLNKFVLASIVILLMAFADFNTFTVLTKGLFTVVILLSLFNEELGGFKKIEIGFDFLFLYGTLKLNESIALENDLICSVIYFLFILRMIFGTLIFRKERTKQNK
jgi:hypothetical protein